MRVGTEVRKREMTLIRDRQQDGEERKEARSAGYIPVATAVGAAITKM